MARRGAHVNVAKADDAGLAVAFLLIGAAVVGLSGLFAPFGGWWVTLTSVIGTFWSVFGAVSLWEVVSGKRKYTARH